MTTAFERQLLGTRRPLATPSVQISAPPAQTTARVSAAVAPTSNATLENRHRWERAYRWRLRLSDTAVVIGSTGVAAWIQIAAIAQVDLTDAPWQYGRVFVLTASVWLLFLALFQTRSPRVVGQGIECRRVLHATGMAFGVAAIAFVIMQSQ